MAYDEQLANRIRRALGDRRDFTERKMFGGLAFLCQGRMCCGIVGGRPEGGPQQDLRRIASELPQKEQPELVTIFESTKKDIVEPALGGRQ